MSDTPNVVPADAVLLRDIANAADDDAAIRDPDGIMRVVAMSNMAAARLRALANVLERHQSRPGERWVRVADELVAQLSAEWSEPVRVKITADDGHELQLVLTRSHPLP